MSPFDAQPLITDIVEAVPAAKAPGKRFHSLSQTATREERAAESATRRRVSRAATKAFKTLTTPRSKPFISKPDVSDRASAANSKTLVPPRPTASLTWGR